jgi:hypothetical protein
MYTLQFQHRMNKEQDPRFLHHMRELMNQVPWKQLRKNSS